VPAALAAAVVMACNGREGLHRALPGLLVAAAMTAAVPRLWILVFARYRFVPRALRQQLALEFGWFWWNEGKRYPEGRTWCLDHLSTARRSSTGILRERLARVEELVSGSGADDEIDATLRELNRAEHVPRPIRLAYNPSVPSRGVVLLTAVVLSAATLAVVLWTGHACTLRDAVAWLALAGALAHAALGVLIVFDEKVRAVLARRRFRTVVVTDASAIHPWFNALVLRYARLGHVVAVVVDEEGLVQQTTTNHGSVDYFFPRTDALERVTECFLGKADLLVVHSEDRALAARVRASAALPDTRCVALSKDWSQPPPSGYRWLDPIVLRSPRQPAGAYAGEPLDRATLELSTSNPWLRRQHLSFYASAIVGFCLLLRFPNFRALGLLLCACSFLWLASEFAGPRRRRQVSQGMLRAPRSPSFSHRLWPAQLEKRINRAVWLAVAAAWAPALWPMSFSDRSTWFWMGIGYGLLFTLGQAQFGFLVGCLRAIKYYLDWNFRICVFRRNSARFAYAHKAIVMARCGTYGQVMSLQDSTLDETRTNYNEGREDEAGYWLPIFGGTLETLKPAGYLQWRAQVTAELEVADAVVFDWADDVTDNMKWEFEEALRLLPAHRILVMCSDPEAQGVQSLLDSAKRTHAALQCITLPREPDDRYVWAYNRPFEIEFTRILATMMAPLVPEPRPPRRTAPP
jgi:hypothetical protein